MNFGPFARLLGLQRTEKARDRLIALRQKHALTDDDPIWELVAVVEDYCAELLQEAHATTDSTHAAATQPATSPAPFYPWRIAALCSAAGAIQTLLLALSFVAGVHAAHVDQWMPRALSVPVGWVMFTLLLPLLGGLINFGWRARHREPAIGWSVITCSAASTSALCWALWQIF